jgi:hypothetical protein
MPRSARRREQAILENRGILSTRRACSSRYPMIAFPRGRVRWGWLAVIFFFGTVSDAQAVRRGAVVEEPQWFRLQLDEIYTKVNIEGQRERREIRGDTSEREYLYVEPALGVGFRGSVYHPNLLEFNLKGEGGTSWQQLTLDPPGGTSKSTQFLQRYHGGVTFLREKPYATSLFAEKDLTYRDFDFYSRARVDTQRFGGNTGYADRSGSVRLSYFRQEEDVTGLRSGNSANDENIITYNVRNERGKSGRTELEYRRDEFRREQEGSPTQSGVEHSANLFDTETWGKGDRNRLNSMLLIHRLDGSTTDTRSLRLQENLESKHSRFLSSNYRYSFDLRTSGPVDSETNEAGALVRHQLYESLTSVLDLHGSRIRSDSTDTTFLATRFCAGVDESYTKRLPAKGRLSLGFGVRLDREQRETTGALLSVLDEPHTPTDGIVAFLNQPGVDRVGTVTDPAGIPYSETLDYVVLPLGEQTEIRRVSGGRIPNGGGVLVDYTAAAPPSDAFSTLFQSARIRLELFDRLVALYGRINVVTNFGGESLVLQDITDKIAGFESLWRWVRVGAEYEEYDSNLSPYEAVRTFQSFAFEPTDSSTLSLDFTQSRTTYPQDGLTQRSLNFIGRLRARVASPLFFTLEGGVRRERGRGLDQDQATVRTALDFAYGQMTANAGYEFLDETLIGERHVKHYYFLRVKRTF